MAKRIFEIAKELGIKSQAIIEKCLAEGVPADKVRNHMATTSPGLEASIREWFTGAPETEGGGAATAVETTAHVDIDQVRTEPARARPRRRVRGPEDESNGESIAPPAQEDRAPEPVVEAPGVSTVTAVAAPPVPEPVAGPAPSAAAAALVEAPAGGASETGRGPSEPVRGGAEPARAASAPPARRSLEIPRAPAPGVRPHQPATPLRPGTPPARPARSADAVQEPKPAPSAPTRGPAEPARPAASAPAPASAPPAPGGPPGQPPPTEGGGRPPHRPVIRPAPMNVPTRPKIVAPAGEKLKIQAPATVVGPKVVRVETPEPESNFRPTRRPGPGDTGLPRGGPRTGAGAAPGPGAGGGAGTEDDASRSPRRNKRRADTPTGPVPARRRAKGAEEPAPGHAWREQDLLEREARLQRSEGFLKQRRRELKARSDSPSERALTPAEIGGRVEIAAPFTIKDLSAATGVKVSEIIKKLFLQGIMATANSGIDSERAQEIMLDKNIELVVTTAKTAEEIVSSEFESRQAVDLRARSPIITVMGHVDHGKTSLLDRIRNTNVAAGEAGGITQKTSAFRVAVDIGGERKHLVFLDTPGHQAFTEMRSRGANLTDIVVLVVSAADGVMPQTIESINHAKAANVPIVVALNKVDLPSVTDVQIQRVMSQLAEQGLNPTAWGGQTEVVRTSATKGMGIDELLETLDLQAQILELKADFAGPARGRVIEATVLEGRGAVATLMIQDGELSVGDFLVAGRAYGRVRDITDDTGKRLRSAGPATPVQISGLDEVPEAGDAVFVADTLRKAEEAAEQRRERDRLASLQQPKVTLDSLFSQMKDANVKEILIVLKADVQGSVDVIRSEVERLSTEEVKVRVLHGGVGGITEADVALADASKAVVVGFNVIPSGPARSLAEGKGVEIRTYQVIYDITEDVRKAATGMLEPEIRQEIIGHAEVRRVFRVTRVGSIAGCYVTDGMVQRDALIRVTRGGVVIENDRRLEQLKRFKEDAKDVRAGNECGMKIAGYDDIKEGDVLECYRKVEVKRTL